VRLAQKDSAKSAKKYTQSSNQKYQRQVEPWQIKGFVERLKMEESMTVVKITVLETSLKKDLADEYAVPNLEPCPVLKAGQVFYATNTCPKGMCDAAWRTINQYVFALACGVREFYGGGWMKEPGKVITCCNDGLRPVYFKLEATDREAGPFLGRE